MKLKASVDYGMRTVMYLAAQGGICSSREIAEEMAIPRDYLIQLALQLRRAGLIKTRPGKNGGYELAKPADKIGVGEVFAAFDSEGGSAQKKAAKRANASERAQEVYAACDNVMKGLSCYLDAVTVQDMVAVASDQGAADDIIANALEVEVARLRKRSRK